MLAQFFGPEAINDRLILIETVSFTTEDGVRLEGELRLPDGPPLGVAVPPRQRDKVVVQRTGQLMYELSTMYPDISGIQPALGGDPGALRLLPDDLGQRPERHPLAVGQRAPLAPRRALGRAHGAARSPPAPPAA